MLTLFCPNRLRCFLKTKPDTENTLSEGTLVAGIMKSTRGYVPEPGWAGTITTQARPLNTRTHPKPNFLLPGASLITSRGRILLNAARAATVEKWPKNLKF